MDWMAVKIGADYASRVLRGVKKKDAGTGEMEAGCSETSRRRQVTTIFCQ